ncbi:VOC family protein [Noviherbaspirillum denitrificans]|uniref:Glyoxalase-like domain-containing protein n=1 Tax=Noviherbaspirillum denitrificans TaxID=1968433 RepID=A0A254TB85_9BURK|nr:VOC family protein [Noviherbaspirillum denitrificans]OWW18532.1 hypothetical protein AYR66_00290 [Noviherbaspirillum denitrificans]
MLQFIQTTLDHIVVVAEHLEEGVEFCEKSFGDTLTRGGEHVRVGTHNYLLNLDGGIYLEVIAINPAAGATDCPRWFGMDWQEQRRRAAKGPFLATFVARTNQIGSAVTNLPSLGPVRHMQRGSLKWQITIRDDGGLVENGTVPTIIHWPEGVHPTQVMPRSNCRLIRLDAFHPQPAQLRGAWTRIGLEENASLAIRQGEGDPSLVAHLATPNGTVVLR